MSSVSVISICRFGVDSYWKTILSFTLAIVLSHSIVLSKCVTNEDDLRTMVLNAETNPRRNRTLINVCEPHIYIMGLTAIDMSNRIIDLRCTLPDRNDRCTLDSFFVASRMFFGSKTDLTVQNFVFQRANGMPDEKLGGGVMAFIANSRITISGCIFTDNYADSGGAIFMNASTLTIKRGTSSSPVIFQYNYANEVGGALALYNSNLTIKDATVFERNDATYSGAIELDHSIAVMEGVTFKHNDASANNFGSNGALRAVKSTLNLTNATFLENNAFDWSPALQLTESKANLCNVLFENNTSREGGVMAVVRSVTTLKNCTFRNNMVGALFVRFSKVTLSNCLFSNKMPAVGSNIYIGDDIARNKGGSFVGCVARTVFCTGLGKNSIYDGSTVSNTDCYTKGVAGKLGIGVCRT